MVNDLFGETKQEMGNCKQDTEQEVEEKAPVKELKDSGTCIVEEEDSWEDMFDDNGDKVD